MRSNTKNLLLGFVILLWLLVAIIGLFFANKSTETPFDPSGNLYYASNQPDFENQVNKLLHSALNTPLKNVAVHITSSKDCLCKLVANRHIKSVKDMVKSIGKTNETVFVEDIIGLSSILSSTPAIAIFDELGKLSYLGPYATGIGCFSGNGTVEPYLATRGTLGAIIPFESTGCYCHG